MADSAAAEAPKDDAFTATLGLLQQLNEAGELYILLMPPFTAEFEVHEESVRPRLAEHALDLDKFTNTSSEVSTLLHVILEEGQESYKRHVLSDVSEDAKESTREEIERKLKLVQESALASDRLRKRYLLKKSSKAPAFMDIDWERKGEVVRRARDYRIPIRNV